MPVLATITIITLLFGGGSGISFLNPGSLRKQCKDNLDDSPAQEKALALVDELDQLASQYNQAVAAALDTYVAGTRQETSAAYLAGQLAPFDEVRDATLRNIVGVRESMRKALTAEEWENIFG